MKAVIIEDETAAAKNLKAMLTAAEPSLDIVATIESIAQSVEWFNSHEAPDLVFMDIHLADGDSFRIFDLIDIDCPIIFTTAYDQYALDAFKVNSIDYLLKPIDEVELHRALDKFHRLTPTDKQVLDENINRALSTNQQHTFLVQVKDKIIPLNTDDIAYFYTFDERVTAYTLDGKTYPISKTLDKLSAILPQDKFFRANRQFIVARKGVCDITVWFGSRVAINMHPTTPEKIIVSKERSNEFKRWLAES